MTRYIDARRITYSWQVDSDGQKHDGVTLQSIIDKIPTADVVEVRHAYWEPIISHFHGKPTGKYYCSNCRNVEERRSSYCRDCGAKMDLE